MRESHQTIAQRFQGYLTMVYPESPPQRGTVQYQELQRCFIGAFYDGCYKTLEAVGCDNMGSPERWLAEGMAFGKLTKDGIIPPADK